MVGFVQRSDAGTEYLDNDNTTGYRSRSSLADEKPAAAIGDNTFPKNRDCYKVNLADILQTFKCAQFPI